MNLVKRMKSGSYRPNPTRRVYIPKETKGKMRPLGISCYEDKLVENAIAQILEQIYEPKFYNESFGFRPNRNCHQAVREIIEMVQYRKMNYVVEAVIRGFFDNVDHEWLMKMLSHDMADKKLLEIIKNFLKAGIMENGKYLQFFRCRVKTSKKKFRSKIKAMKEWIKVHRAMPIEQIFKTVNAKLRGHCQYYGVTDNTMK